MLCWPAPVKDSSQYRRVDQGWDLQFPVGTPILAVADGWIRFAHDPNGFGDPYPVLVLDQPQGLHADSIYYGHQHPEVSEGQHVKQGDVFAHASQTPGGNAKGLPGWLEIGP